MSRYDREAKLEALYGGKDGLVLVTERGGRKRDKRKVLTDRMSKLMAEQPQPGTDVHQPSSAPVMGSYQKGTLPRAPGTEKDWLLGLLSGESDPLVLDDLAQFEYPELTRGGSDKPTHAYTSERIADRFGSAIGTAAGTWKEIAQGFGEMGRGEPFVSEHGYSQADMAANEQGLQRSEGKWEKRLQEYLENVGRQPDRR